MRTRPGYGSPGPRVSTSAPSPLGAECGTGLGGVGDHVDESAPGLEAGAPDATAMCESGGIPT